MKVSYRLSSIIIRPLFLFPSGPSPTIPSLLHHPHDEDPHLFNVYVHRKYLLSPFDIFDLSLDSILYSALFFSVYSTPSFSHVLLSPFLLSIIRPILFLMFLLVNLLSLSHMTSLTISIKRIHTHQHFLRSTPPPCSSTNQGPEPIVSRRATRYHHHNYMALVCVEALQAIKHNAGPALPHYHPPQYDP